MGISITKDRLGITHITWKSKRAIEAENARLRQAIEALLQAKNNRTVCHTGINACGEDFGPGLRTILDEEGII